MRPKLKPDVYWVRVPDGLYLAGGAGQRLVPGRAIHDWVERIAPFLDGSRTVEDLTHGLPESRRRMVEQVVDLLRSGGYVRDASGDAPHDLTPTELATYADEIAFVEYHRSSAARRFQHHRERRVLLVGSGLTFACLVEASLARGARQITAGTLDPAATDRVRIKELIERAAARDPEQQVALLDLGDGTDRLAEQVAGADVVLHVSDAPAIETATTLEDACQVHGATLVQAMVIGDSAWVGPVQPPGAGRGPWLSLRFRLLANQPELRRPPDGVSPHLAGPTASLLAHHLNFTAFRHVTGVDGDEPVPEGHGDRWTFTEIELRELRTQPRLVRRHPFTVPASPRDEASFLAHVARLAAGEPVTPEAFSTATAGLFDQRVGVLTSLDEGDLTQLPLHVSEATVPDTAALLDEAGELPRTTGCGQDFGEARHRATRAAGEVGASLAVDRRRLLPAPIAGGDAQVWALVLRSGEAVRVDAPRALPHLARPGTPYRRPAGLASGTTWVEAMGRGLLDACAGRVPDLLPDGDGDPGATEGGVVPRDGGTPPFARLSLGALPLDDDGRRYLRMLRAAGVVPALYDLSPILGVPLLAAGEGTGRAERIVGYRAGPSPAAAARDGLELLVLDHQARSTGDRACAPRQVAALPRAWRGRPGLPGTAPDLDLTSREGLRTAAGALGERGIEPVVVPLGDDPALTTAFPYVAQVVLLDV